VRDFCGKARIGIAGENHEIRVISLHERVPAVQVGLGSRQKVRMLAAGEPPIIAAGGLQMKTAALGPQS